uniref:Putative secreted protein n=1 Tax=Ixodes ricinus TaxID=34613 RepID=A0A6B0UIA5_IXORI
MIGSVSVVIVVLVAALLWFGRCTGQRYAEDLSLPPFEADVTLLRQWQGLFHRSSRGYMPDRVCVETGEVRSHQEVLRTRWIFEGTTGRGGGGYRGYRQC